MLGLYRRKNLYKALFSLSTSSGFGSCSFGKTSKTITLYQPMLQYHTIADLKNALLHLMIHAIIFVKHGMTNLSRHGPVFRDWMDAINACSVDDCLRPKGGYCITTTHDFSQENLCSIQGNLWKCESCGATLLRATKLGPPSDSCCIENVSQHTTCGNMLCYWHNHKMDCGGTYVLPKRRGQKMVLKGRLGLVSETSEMSNSQGGDVQESDSDEVEENSTIAKPYAEGKLVSQVGAWNTRSPGGSSSKKERESNMPEDYQKEIVLPAIPRRSRSRSQSRSLGSWSSSKKSEEFQKAIVSSASPPTGKLQRKHEHIISVGRRSNAKSSISNTPSKAGKWHKPEHVQTSSSVQPCASRRKRKLEQDLDVSEKLGVFSLGSCKNAKPPGSNASMNAGKPEGAEKSSVPLAAAPLKKLKLDPSLVALMEKHGDAKPLLGNSTGNKLDKPECIQKAGAAPLGNLKHDWVASQKNVQDNISSKKARKHEETQKPIAATQSILKQQNRTNSSVKAGKLQYDPEVTFFQPAAVSQRKPNPAAPPKRQKTGSKTSSSSPKKEVYGCVSVWANIYELECSSGSDEPLVNKRTERRKRERERSVQMAYYSRSKKRGGASGISSIKAQPAEEEIPYQQTPRGQSQPPTQCMDSVIPPADPAITLAHGDPSIPASRRMDIVAAPPADQVMARAPVDQSQPPAATHQVVQPHSADPPPSSTPSNPSSSPDLIDISDDD